MQVVLTEEEIVAHGNAEERKFLERILLTQHYHLLETRLDYLQRVFERDDEFSHELYFQLLLEAPRNIIRLANSKCTISCVSEIFERAVEKRINISKLNIHFDEGEIYMYYITIIKMDALDLFLEVEEKLKQVLHKKQMYVHLIDNKAMNIIHLLCSRGMLLEIASDCLALQGVLYVEKTTAVLTDIASRYDCTDFFTQEFMRYASLHHHLNKCELLLQLGAKLSVEQREELARTAPEAYQKFFAEDV